MNEKQKLERIICVNCGNTSNLRAGQCLICGGEALAQPKIKYKHSRILFAIIIVLLVGYGFIYMAKKGFDSGNIARCTDFQTSQRELTIKGKLVGFSMETEKMCKLYNIDLYE